MPEPGVRAEDLLHEFEQLIDPRIGNAVLDRRKKAELAAKSENVQFFATAATAERAGFRPCLRCRPEAAPGSPAWNGTATTVARGMRLIEKGFLVKASVADLADHLGIGPRHLLRLFLHHAGATPSEVAATRRVQAAKRLIDQTAMPLSEIAFAAGFRSIRRFNDAFRATYGRPPSSFRQSGRVRPRIRIRFSPAKS